MSNALKSNTDWIELIEVCSKLVQDLSGNILDVTQKTMVSSRIAKYLSERRIEPRELINIVLSNSEQEKIELVSLLTTHHTFFFRESVHFDFIISKLPQLIEGARKRGDNLIRFKSFGCSKGQEVYTLGMILATEISKICTDIDFEIYGSDIDVKCIDYAENGVYREKDLRGFDEETKKKFWLRGKGEFSTFYKIKKEIKSKCYFMTENVLKPIEKQKTYDVILCRNVYIYLSDSDIKKSVTKIKSFLNPDGYFISGICENLFGYGIPGIKLLGQSVYQFTDTVEEYSTNTNYTYTNEPLVNEKEFFIGQDEGVFHIKLSGGKTKVLMVKLDTSMDTFDEYKILSYKFVGFESVHKRFSSRHWFGRTNKVAYTKDNLKVRFNKVKGTLSLEKNSKLNIIKTHGRPLEILLVDDSSFMHKVFGKICESSQNLKIKASALVPSEALELLKKDKFDLIILDVNLPEMSGIDLYKKHLKQMKIPVVLTSSITAEDAPEVLEALSLGVVSFIQKPTLEQTTIYRDVIVNELLAAAKAKKNLCDLKKPQLKIRFKNQEGLILIGSSTGGTQALEKVLTRLPNEIPPIVIVQHIPAVFSKSLANRINSLTRFRVKEAEHSEKIEKNTVYIAEGGKQLSIKKRASGKYLIVSDDPPFNLFKPSVDFLFNSTLKFKHENTIGVILTGMGRDGAKGLLNLKEAGCKTIAQDKDSSVVYGMPRMAIELGACEKGTPLDDIPEMIVRLFNES